MVARRLEYLDYERSRRVPNIVVDGPPNESTVLTLSHWPGVATPPLVARDLSAEIAFAYLDAPVEHRQARVVTNNHFDQDGIVAVHALTRPEEATRHRKVLIDLAAAGDFATYTDRRAARASMTLAHLAGESQDCTYEELTDRLYLELLPQLMSITLDNDRYRALWADEDADLTASEQAVESGSVTFHERADLDLAIVTIADDEPIRHGHRFGDSTFDGLHPMAIHNATDRFRLVVIHGRRYRYIDRYETWVQYKSRPILPRVDMRPLAEALTAAETGPVVWTAGAPGDLTPELGHDGESSIEPTDFTRLVIDHIEA